jgi:hypothetical protein
MKCFGKMKKAESNATLLRGKLHSTSTFSAVQESFRSNAPAEFQIQRRTTAAEATTNMKYPKLEWPSELNGFAAPCTKRDFKIITPYKTNPD